MKKLLCSIKGASGADVEFYDDGTYLNRLGTSRWYIDDDECMRYAHDKKATKEEFLYWGLTSEIAHKMARTVLAAIATKALEENVLS